jgi:hypothetical protein
MLARFQGTGTVVRSRVDVLSVFRQLFHFQGSKNEPDQNVLYLQLP